MKISHATAHKRPTEAKKKLDAIGIDAICDMIEIDMSIADIADKIKINRSTLRDYCLYPDNLARVAVSRLIAARYNDDEALRILQSLPSDATPAQIAQARELAHHHRWRAGIRAPREYGNKIGIEHDISDSLADRLDAARRRVLNLTKIIEVESIENGKNHGETLLDV
jgi:hypothetical protein